MIHKKLFTLGSLSIAILPIATVVSCGSKTNYDIGYSLQEVTNLNYIKYKNVIPLSAALVETFAKSGPSIPSKLASYLNLNKLNLSYKDTEENKELIIRDMATIKYQTGTLRNKDKEQIGIYNSPIYTTEKLESKYYMFNLNGESVWQNGQKLTSSDFIDAIIYTLDLNSGSQNVDEILKLGISNTREFIDYQMEYAKQFGELYKNPFGYKENKFYDPKSKSSTFEQQREDIFPLQKYKKDQIGLSKEREEERKIINKIELTARNIGVYGDQSSSHPINPEKKLYKIINNVPFNEDDPNFMEEIIMEEIAKKVVTKTKIKISPYKLLIVLSSSEKTQSFIMRKLFQTNILPIKRQFVEENGGIHEFGKNLKNFMTQGPFKIEKIIFGKSGSLLLKKDENYHDSLRTIPNKVKIYFQDDPIINSSLFEDGFIAETKINNVYLKKFYSDKSKRKVLSKSSGIGSTAFIFNLERKEENIKFKEDDKEDENTNGNKYLFNSNLRRALMLSIDREEIIGVSSFDTTYPVYSLIGPNKDVGHFTGKDSGTSFAQIYGDQKIKFENGHKAPLYNYDLKEMTSNKILVSTSNKKDKFRHIESARYFMNKFKKENPDLKKVTIEYIHDSSTSLLNMGISLKSQFKKAFGDFINLEIKGYPPSIYNSFIYSGKFDMTYRNLDYLAGAVGGYIGSMMISDGISKKEQKSNGFNTNPSGGWAFNEFIKELKKDNKEDEYKTRLGISNEQWDMLDLLTSKEQIKKNKEDEYKTKHDISNKKWNGMLDLLTSKEQIKKSEKEKYKTKHGISDQQWDDMLDLLTINDNEVRTIMIKNINKFFNKVKGETKESPKSWNPFWEHFNTKREIADFKLIANKILTEQAVMVPAFVVDVIVKISRVANWKPNNQDMYSFDYGYDLLKPPNSKLPGMEDIGDQ